MPNKRPITSDDLSAAISKAMGKDRSSPSVNSTCNCLLYSSSSNSVLLPVLLFDRTDKSYQKRLTKRETIGNAKVALRQLYKPHRMRQQLPTNLIPKRRMHPKRNGKKAAKAKVRILSISL